MTVIARRTTMLAGDRSRGAISPASTVAILCATGAQTRIFATVNSSAM